MVQKISDTNLDDLDLKKVEYEHDLARRNVRHLTYHHKAPISSLFDAIKSVSSPVCLSIIMRKFDETGKTELKMVCKSSDDRGEFIISTQEKVF